MLLAVTPVGATSWDRWRMNPSMALFEAPYREMPMATPVWPAPEEIWMMRPQPRWRMPSRTAAMQWSEPYRLRST